MTFLTNNLISSTEVVSTFFSFIFADIAKSLASYTIKSITYL